MQALINSSGFVQCWYITNRAHKPMSMCYLSDFLIDCSENRGVKKIYKRNSNALAVRSGVTPSTVYSMLDSPFHVFVLSFSMVEGGQSAKSAVHL